MTENTVLSIDPSLSSTGFCIRKGVEIASLGRITTSSKQAEPDRLFAITRQISSLIETYGVTEVVLEDQFLNMNTKRMNVKTLMILSHVRGVIMALAGQHALKLCSYSPSTIKKVVTGNAHASKEEVRRQIKVLHKGSALVIQTLERKGKTDDISDALAIDWTHLQQRKDREACNMVSKGRHKRHGGITIQRTRKVGYRISKGQQ